MDAKLAGFTRDAGNFIFGSVFTKWVAGTKRQDALGYAKMLNKNFNSPATLNYLGEHYQHSSEAKHALLEILGLINDIKHNGIDASVTIKPGQLGHDAKDIKNKEEFCLKGMEKIAKEAKKNKVLLWIDMESSRYVDFTLECYHDVLAKYGNVGVCIQANLKRSQGDLEDLIDACNKGFPVKVRLVKGIYHEDKAISYQTENQTHKNYQKLIRFAFSKSEEDFGIAVASHHRDRINEGIMFQKKYKKEFFEIQVLKGVMPKLSLELRNKGTKVCEYVPYGDEAFAYSVRRAVKNKEMSKSIFLAPFIESYRTLYGPIEVKK